MWFNDTNLFDIHSETSKLFFSSFIHDLREILTLPFHRFAPSQTRSASLSLCTSPAFSSFFHISSYHPHVWHLTELMHSRVTAYLHKVYNVRAVLGVGVKEAALWALACLLHLNYWWLYFDGSRVHLRNWLWGLNGFLLLHYKRTISFISLVCTLSYNILKLNMTT